MKENEVFNLRADRQVTSDISFSEPVPLSGKGYLLFDLASEADFSCLEA